MNVTRWTLGALGAVGLVCATLSSAYAKERALQHYKPTTVSFDLRGADDPGLRALIDRLRAAAAAHNVAAIRAAASPSLAILTPPTGFPPARGPKPVRLKSTVPGPERLDRAVAQLAPGTDEPGRHLLDRLILMAASEALAPGSVSRSRLVPRAYCAPGEPRFNRSRVLAVANAAHVVPDHLVFLTEETTFLERPDSAADPLETLKPGTVVPFLEGAVKGKGGKPDWYAVALPAGKRGYARGDRTLAFTTTRLCFSRSGKGEAATWSLSAIVVPSATPLR